MPDKKLTDKEIVKALEICQKPHDNDTCNNCKYKRNFGCRDALCNDILDLINRLQAESEDYKALYEGLKAEHLETIKAIKHCKADVCKEFAEKLDKVSFITGYTTVFGGKDVPIKHITMANVHNVLKELVGEDNAKEKE